jgi:hypothetical protein
MTEETKDHYEFLDELRESGATNMFGAGPYLQDEFGMGRREAGKAVCAWMESFAERHPTE